MSLLLAMNLYLITNVVLEKAFLQLLVYYLILFNDRAPDELLKLLTTNYFRSKRQFHSCWGAQQKTQMFSQIDPFNNI